MNKAIEFSKDQFKTLLKMTFYGDWISSATKLEDEKDKEDFEASEFKTYILKQAKNFGYKEYVKKFPGGDIKLKQEIELDLLDKVYAHEEFVFWDNLVDKLVQRDMLKKYGILGVEKMSYAETIDNEEVFREKYAIIYENQSIDSLVLKEEK